MLALLLLQSVAGPPLPTERRKHVPKANMPCPVTINSAFGTGKRE